MTPDVNGRYDLSPMGVLIGLENDRVWMYDAKTGERLLDHTEMALARLASEAKAKEETEARAKAEAKARKAAKARAKAEAKAKDAEAKAKDANAKVQQEAERNTALEERCARKPQPAAGREPSSGRTRVDDSLPRCLSPS